MSRRTRPNRAVERLCFCALLLRPSRSREAWGVGITKAMLSHGYLAGQGTDKGLHISSAGRCRMVRSTWELDVDRELQPGSPWHRVPVPRLDRAWNTILAGPLGNAVSWRELADLGVVFQASALYGAAS